jgi:hypothetical protein
LVAISSFLLPHPLSFWQAAVYGLGASSLTCRAALLGALPAVLGALSSATSSAASKKEPAVADNAVTALAKVIYHVYDGAGGGIHPDGTPASLEALRAAGAPPRKDLMRAFVARLPLRHDDEEARVSLQVCVVLALEFDSVPLFWRVCALCSCFVHGWTLVTLIS